MREHYNWNLGRRSVALGKRTLVMGVVNVTPDSFSDGGQFGSPDAAIEHGLRLLAEGADILDIGGESTRPGVAIARGGQPADVSAEQEAERTIPVVEGILRSKPDAVVSIDTYKSATARAAIAAGAVIVNDVSGFRWDPEMAKTVADLRCGAILMHSRGTPAEWRNLPALENPVQAVREELISALKNAEAEGVHREQIVIDPGFGFGKRFEENYPMLAHFAEFTKLGFPVLAGPSRKSFVGRTIGRRQSEISGKAFEDASVVRRLYGTIAAVSACVFQGAHIVRVHDVAAATEALAVADAILAAE
jgi:dihydropteroate synthase